MLDDDDNDDVCDEGQRGLAKKHVHMDGKRRLTNDMSKGSRHASKFRERQQLLGFCCCVNCIITLGGVLTSLSLGGLLPAANSQLGRRPPLPASPSPHPPHPPPHSSPVPHLPRLPPSFSPPPAAPATPPRCERRCATWSRVTNAESQSRHWCTFKACGACRDCRGVPGRSWPTPPKSPRAPPPASPQHRGTFDFFYHAVECSAVWHSPHHDDLLACLLINLNSWAALPDDLQPSSALDPADPRSAFDQRPGFLLRNTTAWGMAFATDMWLHDTGALPRCDPASMNATEYARRRAVSCNWRESTYAPGTRCYFEDIDVMFVYQRSANEALYRKCGSQWRWPWNQVQTAWTWRDIAGIVYDKRTRLAVEAFYRMVHDALDVDVLCVSWSEMQHQNFSNRTTCSALFAASPPPAPPSLPSLPSERPCATSLPRLHRLVALTVTAVSTVCSCVAMLLLCDRTLRLGMEADQRGSAADPDATETRVRLLRCTR